MEHYYKCLPAENIKVILFEDFIKSKEAVIREITEFLDIDFDKFQEQDLEVHSNETNYYKSEKLLLMKNRLLRSYGRKRYSNNIPFPYSTEDSSNLILKMIDRTHKKINKKTNRKPEINKSTINYLNDFFKEEMLGIDELTGLKIYHKWFK